MTRPTDTRDTDPRDTDPRDTATGPERHRPSRRAVLGGTAAAVGGTVAVGAMFRDGFGNPFTQPEPHGTGTEVDGYTAADVIHSMCMQCNTFCTIKVRLVDGGDTGATALVRKIAGNPYSPLTTQPVGPIPYDTDPEDAVTGLGHMPIEARSRSGGIACLKGQAGPQIVHDTRRITAPLKRVGGRGSNRWQSVSWDEALRIILDGDTELGTPGLRSWYRWAPRETVMADWQQVTEGTMTAADFTARWQEVLIDPTMPELGPKANQLSIIGGDRMYLIGERFGLHQFGTINQFNHGGTCGVTGVVANARTHPTTGHKRMYADIDYCRYLIVWGTEPLTAQKGPTWLAPRIGLARENGMKMVVVDPRMSKTAEKADLWVPVLPGQDADLAFGIARWIVDARRYDERYLRAPGAKAAGPIGEPTWSDATHLVKVDSPGRGMLTLHDLGLAPEPGVDDRGKPVEGERAVLVDGRPVGADTTTGLADLDVDTTIATDTGQIRVRSVFNLLTARLRESTVAEYAERAGVGIDVVERIGREFTSFGKRAAVMSYRGPAMHANGFHTVRAIGYLNFLIGNHDWKGGHLGGQQGFSPRAGRYDLDAVPDPRPAWGIPITREKSRYEDSPFFATDGYPARRRWFQFPGNLCHEVIPSAGIGYPYGLNALFLHRHSPLNSSPGGHRLAEVLRDPDKIKLIVSFDTVLGDSSAWADLVLPDPTYLERFTQESVYPSQQYAVTQLGQPTTRALVGPRPVEETYREIARALDLPGVGADAFGPGAHWNTYEDYWLKMAANVAWAGDDPVPDASAEEERVFLEARRRALKDAFDEQRWRAAVTAEEWPKVVYVLNRGGRFEEHGDDRSNGYEGDWLKYRYGGLCAFYDPAVAAAIDPMTGKRFDGLARITPPVRADGTPFPREGLPLRFVNWKARHQGTHRTISSAWLREVRPSNFVTMNPVDAEARGIGNGDPVRVRGAQGTASGIAMVTQTIRPGIVGADAAFGHTHYGGSDIEIDGRIIAATRRYGHEESARKVTPMHEETGYASTRDQGLAVNELLADDSVEGGFGVCDPIGGGAAQLDSWVEVERL